MIKISHSKLFSTDDIIIISESEITHISETPEQELDIGRISETDIADIHPVIYPSSNIQIIFYPFIKIFVKFRIKNVYFSQDITYGCNIEEDTVKRKGIDISFSEEEDFSIKDEKSGEMSLLGALSLDSLLDFTMPKSYHKGISIINFIKMYSA